MDRSDTATGGASEVLSDEELTLLALADNPDQVLDEGAVPLVLAGTSTGALLPQWYMPPARTRVMYGWRSWVVVALVLGFILIEVSGLCSVFGQLVVG